MFLELPRVVGELAASHAVDLVAPRRPSGDGRPVLVIPGFQATDGMTGRLRSHLKRHDFRVHGWAQGANIGLTDRRIDGLIDRFEGIRKQYDEPVSVVGWSFGGVLARWLAHTYPGDVRQIVCLGSPWRADGERTRATGMFERSRRKHGMSDRARPMIDLLRGPVPVPCTAVYSKSDGIVPWRGCAVDPGDRDQPAGRERGGPEQPRRHGREPARARRRRRPALPGPRGLAGVLLALRSHPQVGTSMSDDILGERDSVSVAKALPLLKLAMKGYFRSDVRDMDRVPAGGALMVGNHSGGLMAMDVPIIAVAFAETFGADRPLYCLAHDMLFTGVAGPVMRRFGFVPADRESAQAVLTSGAVTIVFPGGDYDVFRPTLQANVIDFEGRKGYVRTALKAGVPIVPVVSIGGQEAQLHLTRGQWLGRLSPLRKAFRTDLMPLTIGFPFGLTAAGVPNIPLPTKIVTQVLDPIDPAKIAEEFGPDADAEVIAEVDEVVRARMQEALDQLARERRFPVLG